MKVSAVCSKTGSTGENSTTSTAGELDVVNVFGLKMVLEVGGLTRFVTSLTNDTLDVRTIRTFLNHTSQQFFISFHS